MDFSDDISSVFLASFTPDVVSMPLDGAAFHSSNFGKTRHRLMQRKPRQIMRSYELAIRHNVRIHADRYVDCMHTSHHDSRTGGST